jgi:hypothetical protein
VNAPIDVSAAPPLGVSLADEGAGTARPRLRHSITLGESHAGSPPAPTGAAPDAPATVQVNVHTYVPVTINNYGGFDYAVDHDGAPRARTSRTAPVHPGQDFPTPPSYGPQFPYRTGPASPWAR